MVFVNDFPVLLRRNVCKIDGGKLSHRKLEESGAFSVSVAFSHFAHLRNMTAAPRPVGSG